MTHMPHKIGVASPERFDHVLIDEFQDVDMNQLVGAMKALRKDGKVWAFGDPSQMAYMWLGVERSILADFATVMHATAAGGARWPATYWSWHCLCLVPATYESRPK